MYYNALKHLAGYLLRYWNKRPVVLLDEYDTPIHAGFLHGYYSEIITFMRIFLGSGLKDTKQRKIGIIFEFKKVDRDDQTLDQAAEKAILQIKDKQYASELRARGITRIVELGVAFEGKKVLVKQAE